jgi:hypothetical protein
MNIQNIPMNSRWTKKSNSKVRLFCVAASVLVLASCQTTGSQGLSNFDLFGTPQKLVPGEDVVLPRNSKALGHQSGIESTLRMVVELDQQKRFAEARHLLLQVRSAQPSDSVGYQSVASSMAVLALKEGDFDAFKRLAHQLDVSLGSPVRVEAPHTEIITLYRSVTGKTLPVNAPDRMKMLKDKYLPVQKAQLKKEK